MGHPDFRVDKRIFASLHSGDQFGMVKLTPDQQATFIEDHPKAFSPEAGAWGRSGCTRVILTAIDEDTLGEALTLAWRNTKKDHLEKSAGRPAPTEPTRPPTNLNHQPKL